LNRVENGRVTGTFTTAQGLPSNRIRAIERSRDGGLWVGTQAGLALLEQGRFVAMPDAPRGVVTTLGQDASGNLLVATTRGVYVRGPGGFREQKQDGVPIRGVDTFFLDPDGLVWMGTDGFGLKLMDRAGKIAGITVSDGLFDSEIFGILRDAQDRFWMGCSKGLFSVSRAELRRFAAGEIRRVSSSPYSPTDGGRIIEGRSRVQPALWRRRDGIMWFSTTHGLIVLEPNRQRSVAPLPVVIEDPVVNGQPVRPGAMARLAPGQKNIELDYTALSFYAPNRTSFRYILEGFDKDWINADIRREAFYTNLPPGSFRFRVTACTVDGLCNETGAAIEFTLASHYYQRVWFWALAAGLVALVVWLGYQVRIRQLREKYDLILAERSRIARELHDTLIQGFSGITMALQALASRLKTMEERGTLDEIITDAARCLRETRQSVAGLRAVRGPQSGLASAIEDAAREIAGAKDVRLKFRLEPNLHALPAEVEYNLLRIAREAVTNSVKHSGARAIEVSLESDAEAVNLAVKDDGLGFSRDTNGGPGHYGLIGMKERAAQIGAEIEWTSQPGGGTTVAVRLPVPERAPAVALK
jgi:signal transduction histidine kinase